MTPSFDANAKPAQLVDITSPEGEQLPSEFLSHVGKVETTENFFSSIDQRSAPPFEGDHDASRFSRPDFPPNTTGQFPLPQIKRG